jgi:nucleoside 2-deoxyribosyltransferase
MKLVYLAGPIHEVDNPALWRDSLTALIHEHLLGMETLNPLNLEVTAENRTELVRSDLSAILESDYVVAMVKKPSWGTAMEIFFAKQHRIPVIAIIQPENYAQSPWLLEHIDYRVQDYQQAFDKLALLEGY